MERDAPKVFVVDIKPSARRRNPLVGRAVNRDGTRREFPDRRAAASWARSLARPDAPVWLRAADPRDGSDADAYLVSRRPRRRLDGAVDKRRRRLRGADDGEQAALSEATSDEA
ncbi:MAG: hypothetical protein ABEJ79_11640 [Halolamina sp.]